MKTALCSGTSGRHSQLPTLLHFPSMRSLHACLIPFYHVSLHGQGGRKDAEYGEEKWVNGRLSSTSSCLSRVRTQKILQTFFLCFSFERRNGLESRWSLKFLYALAIAQCAKLLQWLTVFRRFFSLILQVYIAEISPAHLRGMLGAMNQVAVTLGIIWAYVIGYFLLWDKLALVGCFPAVLLFVLMFFMPESPRWYLEKNRKSDALKSLLWLRGSQTGIEDECREIEATLGKVG